MGFYADFISAGERITDGVLDGMIGGIGLPPEATEWIALCSAISNAAKLAKIIRMPADQVSELAAATHDPGIDFMRWLRMPYTFIYLDISDAFPLNVLGADGQNTRGVVVSEFSGPNLMERTGKAWPIIMAPDGETGLLRFMPPNIPVENVVRFWSVQALHCSGPIHMIDNMPEFSAVAFALMNDNTLALYGDKRVGEKAEPQAVLNFAVNLSTFLTSPAVSLVHKAPPPKLNAKRARQGRPAVPGWYEIQYRRARSRRRQEDDGDGPRFKQGFRYDVRGHLKHFKRGSMAGRSIWCPPHQRGLENQIYKPKSYRTENDPGRPATIWQGGSQ